MPGGRVSRRAVSPGPRRSPTPLLTRIRATAASAAPSTTSCSRSGTILHAGAAARPIPRLHTCGSAAAQPRLPPAKRPHRPGARRPQRRHAARLGHDPGARAAHSAPARRGEEYVVVWEALSPFWGGRGAGALFHRS